MGGNAFDTPARRIPQKQYATLQKYVTGRLAQLFERIEVPRQLLCKQEHGDLDVIAGWQGSVVGGFEEWKPDVAGDEQSAESIGNSNVTLSSGASDIVSSTTDLRLDPTRHTARKEVPGSGANADGRIVVLGTGKRSEGVELEALRQLCGKLRRALSATMWLRNGNEVSVQIPCQALGDRAEADLSERDFYQVDIMLVRPDQVAFTHFMTSYSSSGVLTGRILRKLSNDLTLHLTHLAVRQSPYFGLPAVEVRLTNNPRSLCEWLGLDYTKWFNNGSNWQDEKEYWAWLTNCSEDSLAGVAFHHMVQEGARRSNEAVLDNPPPRSQLKRRADIADRFYIWLRSEASWARTSTPSSTRIGPADVVQVSSGPAEYVADTSSGKGTQSDSFQPKMLDRFASEALMHWGQETVYQEGVQNRRTAVLLQARRIQEKQERRRLMEPGEGEVNGKSTTV
ncbi:hypothetical protein IAU60_001824 [Kwoniella sp. DSM 27419]